MPENAMNNFLTEIGTFFTQAMNWMGDVLDTVTASPALLVLVIAMPVVGLKIGEAYLNRVNSGKLFFIKTIPSQA